MQDDVGADVGVQQGCPEACDARTVQFGSRPELARSASAGWRGWLPVGGPAAGANSPGVACRPVIWPGAGT
jgi:hypothetical protein